MLPFFAERVPRLQAEVVFLLIREALVIGELVAALALVCFGHTLVGVDGLVPVFSNKLLEFLLEPVHGEDVVGVKLVHGPGLNLLLGPFERVVEPLLVECLLVCAAVKRFSITDFSVHAVVHSSQELVTQLNAVVSRGPDRVHDLAYFSRRPADGQHGGGARQVFAVPEAKVFERNPHGRGIVPRLLLDAVDDFDNVLGRDGPLVRVHVHLHRFFDGVVGERHRFLVSVVLDALVDVGVHRLAAGLDGLDALDFLLDFLLLRCLLGLLLHDRFDGFVNGLGRRLAVCFQNVR